MARTSNALALLALLALAGCGGSRNVKVPPVVYPGGSAAFSAVRDLHVDDEYVALDPPAATLVQEVLDGALSVAAERRGSLGKRTYDCDLLEFAVATGPGFLSREVTARIRVVVKDGEARHEVAGSASEAVFLRPGEKAVRSVVARALRQVGDRAAALPLVPVPAPAPPPPPPKPEQAEEPPPPSP